MRMHDSDTYFTAWTQFPIRLVKQVLQLYMATVVIIVNGRSLRIGMGHIH